MDTKPWYLSRTILGGLMALLAAGAGLAGWSVTPADQAALADAVIALATAGGGVLAIWGRVRATRRIGPVPRSPS